MYVVFLINFPMNLYYPAYLLLQKTYTEHVYGLRKLTVYKANEWEDAFGEKIQSPAVFDAMAFLESKKLLTVTSFRKCSTCGITEEGKRVYKRFESSDEYKAYLNKRSAESVRDSRMQMFFDAGSRERYQEKEMQKLSKVCEAFFGVL